MELATVISYSICVINLYTRLSDCCSLSERDFELVCEETLDSLNDVFEDLAESDLTADDYDVLFAVSYSPVMWFLCILKIIDPVSVKV